MVSNRVCHSGLKIQKLSLIRWGRWGHAFDGGSAQVQFWPRKFQRPKPAIHDELVQNDASRASRGPSCCIKSSWRVIWDGWDCPNTISCVFVHIHSYAKLNKLYLYSCQIHTSTTEYPLVTQQFDNGTWARLVRWFTYLNILEMSIFQFGNCWSSPEGNSHVFPLLSLFCWLHALNFSLNQHCN